jgi:hypothetical protein
VARVVYRIYNVNNVLVTTMTTYRTSGTNLSGTWANDWAIPCTSLVGQYRIEAQASDAAGNSTAWSALPNVWVWPSTTQDKAVPVIASGNVAPNTVAACKAISEVKARATDDVGVKSVVFKLVDANGSTRITETAYMRSGTKQDGFWLNDVNLSCSIAAGRYTLHAQATDEWQKASGWVNIGTVDVTAAAAPAPAPSPSPSPVASPAAMTITNYAVASSVRNAPRSAITSKSYVAKSTYFFVSSILFANGQNSGLLSIGHLLSAVSTTPSVCTVGSVATQDNTGGIFTLASVNTLTAGTCSVTWSFAGTATRAATSTTMNLTVK